MKHKGLFISFIVFLALGVSFLFGMIAYLAMGGDFEVPLSDGLGVVEVEGMIASADDAVEQLDEFRKSERVKGVVLRLATPGGSVAASQEILEAVKRVAGEKPVVASMGAVAASGGYYIACGANKILANPGTITGSIGVRMEHLMVGELLRWAKVQHETLKSGRFKDLGSMDRPMTGEEREILQGMLEDLHRQFKEEVASARKMDMAKVDELADGRVYSGRQALALGLVDGLGGFSEAVKQAGEMARIKGEPKLIRPKKRMRLVERLLEGASGALDAARDLPRLEFWQPLMIMR